LFGDLNLREIKLLISWRNHKVLSLKEIQVRLAVSELNLTLQVGIRFQLLVIIKKRIVQVIKNHFFRIGIGHFLPLICLSLDQILGLTLAHGKFDIFQKVDFGLFEKGCCSLSLEGVRCREFDEILNFVKTRLQNHDSLFEMVFRNIVK
jgi:hypothetical protein